MYLQQFKNKTCFWFMVLSLTFVSSVSIKVSASDSHDHSKMNHSKSGMRKELSTKSKNSVIAALEANEQLHASFFNYDAKKVESNAKILKDKISKIEDKEISKLLVFASTKLSEITAENDRKENDQNYHLVSMALIHIVNKFDVGSKYNAYSCPMVKKKWLQSSANSEKINNPYAPNMPHCGSKDTNF